MQDVRQVLPRNSHLYLLEPQLNHYFFGQTIKNYSSVCSFQQQFVLCTVRSFLLYLKFTQTFSLFTKCDILMKVILSFAAAPPYVVKIANCRNRLICRQVKFDSVKCKMLDGNQSKDRNEMSALITNQFNDRLSHHL